MFHYRECSRSPFAYHIGSLQQTGMMFLCTEVSVANVGDYSKFSDLECFPLNIYFKQGKV